MKARARLRLAAAVLVFAWQALLAQVAHQHHPPHSGSEYIKALEDPSRAEWQKPEEVVRKLELQPGQVIADLGAGSGYFTVRFARAVGPTGKVFAIDVDPQMLAYVARRAKEERLDNVQTVLAASNDPKLAPASVDLIFIANTLHHIADRERYYPLLARALKPGGRFANIDFHRRPLPVGPPVEMKIAESDMIKEAQAAGFRLAKEFDFLKYQYFLVFKPQT